MELRSSGLGTTENAGLDRRRLRSRRSDALTLAWRVLLYPWLLFGCGLLLLLLIASAQALPQLPGQLLDEPAARARWLLTVTSDAGFAGPLLRSAGLYDVMHSVLFRIALALLTLVMAAHLADRLGSALVYDRVRRHLCSLQGPPGEPLPLASSQPIYRARFAVSSDTDRVREAIRESMADLSPTIADCRQTTDSHQSFADIPLPYDAGETPNAHMAIAAGCNWSSAYLQVLLPLGLLIALACVWLFLLVGWWVESSTIGPGGSFRAPSQNLLVRYQVTGSLPAADTDASISVEMDGQTVASSAVPDFEVRGGANIVTGRRSAPGLVVRAADGNDLLAEPGQIDTVDRVGVVLPSPGSEESVLIPDTSLGLRIVRRTDDPDSFIVESYQGADLQPVQRIDVTEPVRATVGSGDGSLELEFVPLPGIVVTVVHMPGRWLVWLAVTLVVLGVVGVIRAPSFAVAQISSWPVDRSLVILQTSRRLDLNRLRAAAVSTESTAHSE